MDSVQRSIPVAWPLLQTFRELYHIDYDRLACFRGADSVFLWNVSRPFTWKAARRCNLEDQHRHKTFASWRLMLNRRIFAIQCTLCHPINRPLVVHISHFFHTSYMPVQSLFHIHRHNPQTPKFLQTVQKLSDCYLISERPLVFVIEFKKWIRCMAVPSLCIGLFTWFCL
jgi:hypothetical protein